VTLLTELAAFFTEHERCGELDAGVEGPVVWIACDCGVAGRLDRLRLRGQHGPASGRG
jgi:hypothetical protein